MSIRELERDSIRDFLETNANLLTGSVLDFGCGTQPYRDIVDEAGGSYHGWDKPSLPGSVVRATYDELDDMVSEPGWQRWDAIVCTQVIQYAWFPGFLRNFSSLLVPGGWLLMTGPTNWPVVELEDRYRFTVPAIDFEMGDAYFTEIETAYRADVKHNGETWPLGWWTKGRA